jgi:hypothetical protein
MNEACISKLPRFQSIDRTQIFLRTTDVESLIAEDHPARAIWIFLSRLDLSKFLRRAACRGGRRGQIRDFPAPTIVDLDLFVHARRFERTADQPGDGA